jgi:5-methyltetrahydrofolate--homocysteine methyltransferase
MDDCGMPQDLEGRLRIARMISQEVEAAGVSRESLYFDMLVRPISTDQLQVKAVLEAVRGVRLELPNTHTICGLSNISFGLPARNQINRAFLVLALEAGLDAVILDPTEPGVMAAVYATNAILGRDDYCLQYIAAEREGKLI